MSLKLFLEKRLFSDLPDILFNFCQFCLFFISQLIGDWSDDVRANLFPSNISLSVGFSTLRATIRSVKAIFLSDLFQIQIQSASGNSVYLSVITSLRSRGPGPLWHSLSYHHCPDLQFSSDSLRLDLKESLCFDSEWRLFSEMAKSSRPAIQHANLRKINIQRKYKHKAMTKTN